MAIPKELKRVRGPGTIEEARAVAWQNLQAAQQSMLDAESMGERIRCGHWVTQATLAYARLVETSDQEERIAAIERTMKNRK